MRDITDVPIALAAIKAAVDYFLSEDKDFINDFLSPLQKAVNCVTDAVLDGSTRATTPGCFASTMALAKMVQY